MIAIIIMIVPISHHLVFLMDLLFTPHQNMQITRFSNIHIQKEMLGTESLFKFFLIYLPFFGFLFKYIFCNIFGVFMRGNYLSKNLFFFFVFGWKKDWTLLSLIYVTYLFIYLCPQQKTFLGFIILFHFFCNNIFFFLFIKRQYSLGRLVRLYFQLLFRILSCNISQRGNKHERMKTFDLDF